MTAVLSKLWSAIYGIKSIICISQILQYASLMDATYLQVMCQSQYPPNFSEKKNGKNQNSVSCTEKNILFLVSTRNDNISRGCATKTEFPEQRGGPFWELIFGKSRGEGGHRKDPFHGGVWIFSETTHFDVFCDILLNRREAT